MLKKVTIISGPMIRGSIKVGTAKKTSSGGDVSELIVYECENCNECPLKVKCKKSKNNRQLWGSKHFISKREVSYENVKTEKGTMLRMESFYSGSRGLWRTEMGS